MFAQEIRTTGIPSGRVLVWDPLVRLSHWALVAAFAIAYLSAEDEAGGPSALHVWGGYVIGGIIVLRVVWGFVGPLHARFSDFVRGPFDTLRYMADLIAGRARRCLGHSPAGGAMTIALLICLAITVATGLIAYGERGKGPLANAVPVTIAAHADQGENEQATSSEGREKNGESVIGDLHATFANISLGLIVLHIIGVGLASLVHRENLVTAMITGSKRAER